MPIPRVTILPEAIRGVKIARRGTAISAKIRLVQRRCLDHSRELVFRGPVLRAGLGIRQELPLRPRFSAPLAKRPRADPFLLTPSGAKTWSSAVASSPAPPPFVQLSKPIPRPVPPASECNFSITEDDNFPARWGPRQLHVGDDVTVLLAALHRRLERHAGRGGQSHLEFRPTIG
jgi:hypothetical protein